MNVKAIIAVFTVVLLIGCAQQVSAQTLQFTIKAKHLDNEKRIKDFQVNLCGPTDTCQYLRPNKKGEISFGLDFGGEYTVFVEKEGMVSRYFIVDFKGAEVEDPEVLENRTSTILELTLFEQQEGVDYTYILEHPITTCFWINETAELEIDQEEAQHMMDALDVLFPPKESDQKK